MTFFYQKGRRKQYERRLLHIFTGFVSSGVIRSECGATFRYQEVQMSKHEPYYSFWVWCKECHALVVAEKVALKLGEEDGKRANGKMG